MHARGTAAMQPLTQRAVHDAARGIACRALHKAPRPGIEQHVPCGARSLPAGSWALRPWPSGPLALALAGCVCVCAARTSPKRYSDSPAAPTAFITLALCMTRTGMPRSRARSCRSVCVVALHGTAAKRVHAVHEPGTGTERGADH